MRLIRVAMCDLMPRVDGLPGMRDTDVDAFLQQFRQESTWAVWLGVVAGAVVFTLGPVLTLGRPVLSWWLSREDRGIHAHRIATHPVYLVRQAVVVLKLASGMCWGTHARSRAAMALPPYGPDPGTWWAE